MLAETLLPLGKLDPGLREPDTPLHIADFGRLSVQAEELGYDAVLVEETKDDPYQCMALGAAATTSVGFATSAAMAFPRSPTVTAMSAWSLQKLSNGRFTLGLGTQVRGHIQRRFGIPWHPPAPWMRDYINAMRAVWDTWQNQTPLDFTSEHYNLNLMVPLFDPGPIDHPKVPVHITAIGPNMCALAGELADGVRLHPVCTSRYIEEAVMPALDRGAKRTGRDSSAIEVCLKPLVGTAANDAELAQVAETVRARVAFYLSTPSYRRTFELHGWGEIAEQAARLSKAKKWDELPSLVHDEMLHTVATLGTYDTMATKLTERFGHLLDRIEYSMAVTNPDEADVLTTILRKLQATNRDQ